MSDLLVEIPAMFVLMPLELVMMLTMLVLMPLILVMTDKLVVERFVEFAPIFVVLSPITMALEVILILFKKLLEEFMLIRESCAEMALKLVLRPIMLMVVLALFASMANCNEVVLPPPPVPIAAALDAILTMLSETPAVLVLIALLKAVLPAVFASIRG